MLQLSKLGEFGLIKLLKKYRGSGAGVIKGIGDDTAVVLLDAKRQVLWPEAARQRKGCGPRT